MTVQVLDAFVKNERLHVRVDRAPDFSAMRFHHKGRLWWSEMEGMVRFYAWKGPGNEGGFGGDVYKITTVDGETVELKGPWSSRPGVMNRAGFPPCMEAQWIAPGLDYYRPGHILVSLVQDSGLVELERRVDVWQFKKAGVVHAPRVKGRSDDAACGEPTRGGEPVGTAVDCMACIAAGFDADGEPTWHALG